MDSSSLTDHNTERVLCALTLNLPPSWRPALGEVRLEESSFWDALEPIRSYWLRRSKAERSPEFKQWIPYCLVQNSRGELAAYPRQGSEARLHGHWSLGIGGHVNLRDFLTFRGTTATSWKERILNGLKRELAEEFPGAEVGSTQFLGLINEDTTPVGQMHIGVVFLQKPTNDLLWPGPELNGLCWLEPQVIGTKEWPLSRFESWSQLALRLTLGR